MFLFYALGFFKKGDTIQGGTLFKGGHYLRKYGNHIQWIYWAKGLAIIWTISYPNRPLCTAALFLELERRRRRVKELS